MTSFSGSFSSSSSSPGLLSKSYYNLYALASSCPKIACVAWRFWLGALSNKGGRGQRNREEIGAEATWFLFFSRLRRSFSRASRANFAATPLLRPARQNRHATQASPKIASKGKNSAKNHLFSLARSLFRCLRAFFAHLHRPRAWHRPSILRPVNNG